MNNQATKGMLPQAFKQSAVDIYREIIMENIEYDTLTQDPKMDKERLDEIVDLMLETVCSARKTLRIAGDDYPAELVKSKFLKLNSSHIEFVMDCMRENTTKIRNIKQYLRAVLFNAPSTIDNYYTALVAHDILYAFACPSHHNTVTRLKWLTALTVDPEAKRRMLGLARKMETEVDESWYEAFYHHLRMEMDEYRRLKRNLRVLKSYTDYEEDLYDEAV